ncbi:hypothetical protein Tco_1299386 [Tanacetum coccineum]
MMSPKTRQLVQMKELINDNDSDDDNDGDNKDDNIKNDDDGDSDADDSEKTYSDLDEKVNPNLNLKDNEEEETQDDDSSVSSDFASKFLNLDNVPTTDNEVASMMNVKDHLEESSTQAPPLLTEHVPSTTVPLTIQPFTPIPHQSTPTTTPTTEPITSSIPALLDFSSLFGFDQRVSALEMELSQFKQVDHSVELLATIKQQIPAIVDDLLIQEEKDSYVDVIEKSIKGIIKDEVKSQLPQILPKEVSDFATPVIQSTVNESLENVILAKSSSQPKLTYEFALSLTEFELKKILLDKLKKSKSYRGAPEHKDLYDALVKSYHLDKDLFESYGKTYSLKRDREDKDKDEDPPAGSDQGLKKWKTSKDVDSPKGSKSKDYNSSSSKGTKTHPKSSGKSTQAEEPVFEAADTKLPQNQGTNVDHTDD